MPVWDICICDTCTIYIYIYMCTRCVNSNMIENMSAGQSGVNVQKISVYVNSSTVLTLDLSEINLLSSSSKFLWACIANINWKFEEILGKSNKI